MGGLGDGISLAERFARHSHEARKAGMLEAAAIADRDRRAFEERAKNQNLTRNERTRCSHYVQALTEQAIAIRSVVGGEDSHNA